MLFQLAAKEKMDGGNSDNPGLTLRLGIVWYDYFVMMRLVSMVIGNVCLPSISHEYNQEVSQSKQFSHYPKGIEEIFILS